MNESSPPKPPAKSIIYHTKYPLTITASTTCASRLLSTPIRKYHSLSRHPSRVPAGYYQHLSENTTHYHGIHHMCQQATINTYQKIPLAITASTKLLSTLIYTCQETPFIPQCASNDTLLSTSVTSESVHTEREVYITSHTRGMSDRRGTKNELSY